MAAWSEPRKRPSRVSQCGRILALLERDRGWWKASELMAEVPSVLHTRIAELRSAYGVNIEHRTTGPGAKGSEYRLAVGDTDVAEDHPPRIGGPASVSPTASALAGAVPSSSPPAGGTAPASATVSQAEGGVGPFIPPASRAHAQEQNAPAVALESQVALW